MTSLLQDKLYEINCQAPSPSKDFHHFIITKTEVIWRSWRISFRPNQEKIFPKEVRKLHSDFLRNEQLHKEVQTIFGNKMLKYTLNLCQGRYDFLVRMPDKVVMHILSFLNADDIRQLSNTCKKFQQVILSWEIESAVDTDRVKPYSVWPVEPFCCHSHASSHKNRQLES
uniref:F-box domain-containing protein n=1 Tax=Pelusios castaneus TaxID=367368 RepID=A0A8C8R9W9_9SAUR